MTDIRVTELAVYPVKSFAQISLTSARVESFGLQHDRRWMVVDHNGKFITQRQQSRMCLVQPELIENGVRLSVPGMPSIDILKPQSTERFQVTVWHDHCNVLDAGDEAAAWLSQFLDIDCRLVYFPDDEVRTVDQTYAKPSDKTAFSDGFPLLLISQASLDDLNSRMQTPIPMVRFRPNLVVNGCGAFAEDKWRRLRIGDVTYRVAKPCSRCVIPSIDIQTAERGAEPTRTLLAYRKRDNKIYFGQNVIADGMGEIQVGMPVEILE